MGWETFPGRLALQQRVLPAYRAPFLDLLASACQGGLSVLAGQPLEVENIAVTDRLSVAQLDQARNRHFLSPDSPLFALWQPGLETWLERVQPDALIVEANSRYLSTRQAVRWMHARGRPVLGWGLGAPPLYGKLAAPLRSSRRSFLRSLDGLIAYSRRGAEEYRREGVPAGRVFVALNAAAPRPQKAPPARPDAFPEGRPNALFVGRLQARKRIDNLLQACAELPAALQPRLWVVGDGPERAAFQTLAGELYPRAEFLGDRRGTELDALFDRADLFVLPGTGGLAVQQAMAHGLPVVVAEGDGTQADLVRPENGWLVPPANTAALQAALQEALSDPARLRRKGEASYRIVAGEVNLEAMVRVFVDALNGICNGEGN